MTLVPFPGSQSGALQTPPEDDDEPAGETMSFLEHLDELRKRIIKALLGVLVGILATFAFHDRIFNFVFAPTRSVLPHGTTLIYNQPGEAFSLHLQIALIAGIVVAAPYIMFQVWKFIAPGLYSNEKRMAIPFVLFSTLGFLGGALFNHYVVFRFMIAFFASFDSADLRFLPTLDSTFDLYTKFLLAMGVVFQMPTLVFFLAKMKMITARFLIRQFKYAFLVIFIIAAVITPTGDPVTQTIFAAPMVILYLFGIVIAWVVGPKS